MSRKEEANAYCSTIQVGYAGQKIHYPPLKVSYFQVITTSADDPSPLLVLG